MKNLILVLIALNLFACNLNPPQGNPKNPSIAWGNASDCMPAFQTLISKATSLTMNVSMDSDIVSTMGTPDLTGTGIDSTIMQYEYSVSANSGSCGYYIFNVKNHVLISIDQNRIYNP